MPGKWYKIAKKCGDLLGRIVAFLTLDSLQEEIPSIDWNANGLAQFCGMSGDVQREFEDFDNLPSCKGVPGVVEYLERDKRFEMCDVMLRQYIWSINVRSVGCTTAMTYVARNQHVLGLDYFVLSKALFVCTNEGKRYTLKRPGIFATRWAALDFGATSVKTRVSSPATVQNKTETPVQDWWDIWVKPKTSRRFKKAWNVQ